MPANATPHSFAGKTVLITGGAGGIGRAIAREFMRVGAKAVLADRDEAALLLAAESFLQEDYHPLTIPCDITDYAQCQEAARKTAAWGGGIDFLINNAGLTQIGLCENNDVEVYRRVMDVNFFGSLHMTKACLPSIIERQGGIAVLSSVAGFAPLLGRTGYCASKHALHGFFDTLRAEMRPRGVSVTIVCPTFVQTGFSDKGLAADGSTIKQPRSDTGKAVSADDVARALTEGVRKKESRVIVGATGKLAWWVCRLLPDFYESRMARRFEREFKRDGGR
ncbi:MAG: SDR family oxidoreductase [Candidatus Hydrogenedens sp.]|nr:SDR family oxidoreductase [Candidatus Hydrogenedens sp.]